MASHLPESKTTLSGLAGPICAIGGRECVVARKAFDKGLVLF